MSHTLLIYLTTYYLFSDKTDVNTANVVQVDGVSTENHDILAFDFIVSIIYFDNS